MIDDPEFLGNVLFAGAVLLVGLALVLTLRAMAARSLANRVSAAATRRTFERVENVEPAQLGLLPRMLRWVGETIRGRTRFYSEKDVEVLETMVSAAGLKPQVWVPVLLGTKVVMVIAVPLAALLYGVLDDMSTPTMVLMVCVSLPVGLLGPDYIIKLARGPYLEALRRGVPDALDLLVVCSEAGMGLENALEHVSSEMRHSNVAMSQALAKLLDDIRVLPDRRDAFRNFADRTGVMGARRVSTVLGQSMKYGTPLSQALRSVAVDLRRERMISLEGKASKLPVLLTLPLILFIMPSLFIVLIGPAFIQLTDALKAMQ